MRCVLTHESTTSDQLADFYGVSVDYIMGRTNIKKPYPKK